MKTRACGSAFTLIEVLIVVVIMAILAATIIPQFTDSTKDAKASTATFNLHTLRAQIELYRTCDADERAEIVGLQPGRAEIILAGACIVRGVLTKLGNSSLTVSDRGLRHGLLRERFG